jgi:hypothetical protein
LCFSAVRNDGRRHWQRHSVPGRRRRHRLLHDWLQRKGKPCVSSLAFLPQLMRVLPSLLHHQASELPPRP